MAGNPKNILVVEDDTDLRLALTRALEAVGYQVREAADGQAGLAAITEQRPDLILLDLLMPQMSGQDMMHKVEELPGGVDIPVLVLTNLEMGDKHVQQISRNRPTWYLTKSDWTLQDIVEKIGVLLAKE